MTEFFHSQAFAFLLGIFIGGIIGFFTAAILAASARASREEERMVYDAYKREEARRGYNPITNLDNQFIELLEEANRLGVGEKEFIDSVLKRYKQVPKIEIVKQNNPRTD